MSHKDTWSRHTVAIPSLKRTFERIVKADDWDKDNKKGTHVVVEEMVHMHDVYRLKIKGKKKADPRLWHRGALVGTV
jgi:ribosome maturation protein Sdo1